MKKDQANQSELCDICGKPGVITCYVSESYGSGPDLFVIEDIPMHSCPNCREDYFTAKTLHEIERVKANRGEYAENRQVPVARLP